MTKLISKYLSGGATSDNEAIMEYLNLRLYKDYSPKYQEGKFLGQRWHTRYDNKVDWNGHRLPSWMFVQPDWSKMPKPAEPNYDGLIRGAKYIGEWFSSLFNNKPEPTLGTNTNIEPKERPGIGKSGDR